MYSKKVMEHFMDPHNVGDMDNPSAEAEAGNPICGDMMKFAIKVTDGKIDEIKFKTFGCGAAIASSSVLTDMVKGKTLKEAFDLTKDDVVEELGGLPAHKIHCSVLGIDALRHAICEYWRKQGKLDEHPECARMFSEYSREGNH